METLKLGVDPGFGGIKVALAESIRVVTFVLPSVVGVGVTDSGALNLAGVINSRRRQRPHVVGFDGVEYLVGHGVAEYARPIERMDLQRFSDSPELRALLYAALYQIVNGGNHRLALAIGLPVEILQAKALADSTEREMSRWLVGQHTFTFDGVEARLEIANLRAKIAQPLATWFDWGLNYNGQWVRSAEGAKAPALIIDIGFNTLDLLVVERGQISMRYTGGDRLGMRRAAEMAGANIERRYGVQLSLHEADGLAQRVINGQKVYIHVEGAPVEVSAPVRQALTSLAGEVIRFVERSAGNGKKFKILATGGGSLALGSRLLEQYPHAVIPNDPALANARGLGKLAQRAGFLE